MAEATGLADGAEQSMGWIGNRLDDIAGVDCGRVEGVFIDSDTGGPVWLVYRIGRFGRRAAAPVEFAVGGGGRVWVPFERDLLRKAPRVDLAAGLRPKRELALCEHYGVSEGSRRRLQLAGREREPLTAVRAG